MVGPNNHSYTKPLGFHVESRTSDQAWRPDIGFIVAMKYKHVPYGPGIWPAFWLVNSDVGWPKGAEIGTAGN